MLGGGGVACLVCVLRNQLLDRAHAADAHIRFTLVYNRTLTLKTIKCATPRRKGRCARAE